MGFCFEREVYERNISLWQISFSLNNLGQPVTAAPGTIE
jgi:hypothetical protein